MAPSLERTVRRVVERTLGVPGTLLRAGASLRQDLGADDRRLEDMLLRLEARVGVRVGRVLDDVRTYGDLVAATLEAVRGMRERLARESLPLGAARVRIVGAGGRCIERAGPLTPYLLEAVCDDARGAGPGANVSIVVRGAVSDAAMEGVALRLEGLTRRGIGLHITREAAAPLVA